MALSYGTAQDASRTYANAKSCDKVAARLTYATVTPSLPDARHIWNTCKRYLEAELYLCTNR